MTDDRRSASDPQAEVSGDPLETSALRSDAPSLLVPVDWRSRIQEAVEIAGRKKATRRVERAALSASRRRGLERRHAVKLARNGDIENPADAVSNTGPSPLKAQVRDSSPVGKSGTGNTSSEPAHPSTTNSTGEQQ